MATVSSAAQTALTAPIRQYVTKLEWLSWDETTVLGDYTAYSVDDSNGSLTVDASKDVRRTFTMTINNASGLFIPNGALTSMGVKVRLKRGIVTPSGTVYWSRGIFCMIDPESDHNNNYTNAAEITVTLNGTDKWSLINGDLGGTLTTTTIITAGTLVSDAIRALLPGETKFSFDVCTATCPYDVTTEAGNTIADLVKELALIPSFELFYDVDGYLRFRAILDATQKTPVADLSVGGAYRNCFVSSAYKPTWSKVKNLWQIIGYSDSTSGITYTGSAQDNNPQSPTNTASPSAGIGVKAAVLTDTNIVTNDLCNQRGGYELKENLKAVDVSDHYTTTLPFLNEGDVIQLQDAAAGIADANYEIQQITEPFNNDLSTFEVWKVKSVFENTLDSTFASSLSGWQTLGTGVIDVYGISGVNVMRKSTNADPNGGYCVLPKTIYNFELIAYTRRDATGQGNNHYSLTDSSGNGYTMGLCYDGQNLITIATRTTWAYSGLASVAFTPSLSTWYTLRLIKSSNTLTLEIYLGQTLNFINPAATVSVTDATYSSFTEAAVNGGYDFYSQEIIVRNIF